MLAELNNTSGRVGERHGTLTVVAKQRVRKLTGPHRPDEVNWHCRCSCGRHLMVADAQLANTRDCGLAIHTKQSHGARMPRQRITRRTSNENVRHAAATSQPLATRITAALGGNGAITAATLAALISEVNRGIEQADADVEAACQQSLDPATADPATARTVMQEAEFAGDRLRAALPGLQSKYQQVYASEKRDNWQHQCDQVKGKRDALATEFAQAYPALVGKLIDLFTRSKAIDAEVSRINGSAPNNAHHRLDRLTPPCIAQVRLPDLNNPTVNLWPPPAPPILPEQIQPTVSHPGADWWQAHAGQRAEALAANQKTANFYKQQTADREKREAAERAEEARKARGVP